MKVCCTPWSRRIPSAQLTSKLQSTVSAQIVQQRTSSIGVSTTIQVPAHSRVLGQYGVEIYQVPYQAQRVWRAYPNGNCYDQGTVTGTTLAPTLTEGRRFTSS